MTCENMYNNSRWSKGSNRWCVVLLWKDRDNECRAIQDPLKHCYLSSKVVNTEVQHTALGLGVQGCPNVLVELIWGRNKQVDKILTK